MFAKNYVYTTDKQNIPAEQKSSLWLGIFVHLGPISVLLFLLAKYNFTITETAFVFLAVSLVNLLIIITIEKNKPNIHLPPATFNEWSSGLSLVFFKGFFCGALVVISLWWLLSIIVPSGQRDSNWWLIAAAVLLTDLAYYWIHRLLNHGRGKNRISSWFRRMHLVHHSVGELDFLRGNVSSFFDTAVTGFQISLAVIATVLGLDLKATLISYGFILLLQATHHANFTFNIGYLRFFFMDNHAHKMHHCPRGYLVNHGALFSLWDQMFGTFYEDWNLSPGYMQRHHCALPVKPIKN